MLSHIVKTKSRIKLIGTLLATPGTHARVNTVTNERIKAIITNQTLVIRNCLAA